MKRNFDLPILDLDAKPVRAGATPDALLSAIGDFMPLLNEEQRVAFDKLLNEKVGAPITLKDVCVGALMGVYDEDKNLSDGARIDRLELARRVHKGGIQEIEPKDRDLIKPLLKNRYAGILVPVVAGELLEQDVLGTS